MFELLIEKYAGYIDDDVDYSYDPSTTLEHGQNLAAIGEDFCKAAEETQEQVLMDIGEDLIDLGGRLTAGLAKTAADGYDIEGEYAEIGADLYKVASLVGEIADEAEDNETLNDYANYLEDLTDAITEELGVEKVAEELVKEAGLGGGFARHFDRLYKRGKNHMMGKASWAAKNEKSLGNYARKSSPHVGGGALISRTGR